LGDGLVFPDLKDLKLEVDHSTELKTAPDPIIIKCEVEETNKDGWLYATGGFLAATAIWGLYFYKKEGK
jgi:hypothetical protein